MGEIGNRIRTIGEIVSSVAAPAMEAFIGDFDAWIGLHKTDIENITGNFLQGTVKGFEKFGELVKKYFPDTKGFFKIFEDFNGWSGLTVTALSLLAAGMTSLGLSLVWAHPWLSLFSAAILLLQREDVQEALKQLGPKFEEEDARKETEYKKKHRGEPEDKSWGKAFKDIGNDILYKIASPENKAIMDKAELLKVVPNQTATSHTVTINQTINGDSAMGVANEVFKGTRDALTQTYPGAQVPVVN
jgi:hypothetical protein